MLSNNALKTNRLDGKDPKTCYQALVFTHLKLILLGPITRHVLPSAESPPSQLSKTTAPRPAMYHKNTRWGSLSKLLSRPHTYGVIRLNEISVFLHNRVSVGRIWVCILLYNYRPYFHFFHCNDHIKTINAHIDLAKWVNFFFRLQFNRVILKWYSIHLFAWGPVTV